MPINLNVRSGYEGIRGFDPVLYGADPLGVSDSAAGLRAAISAATAAGGGYITLSAGTFFLNSTVTTAANIWITGSGINTTVLKAAATLSAASNMLVLSGDFVGIAEVMLDGNN